MNAATAVCMACRVQRMPRIEAGLRRGTIRTDMVKSSWTVVDWTCASQEVGAVVATRSDLTLGAPSRGADVDRLRCCPLCLQTIGMIPGGSLQIRSWTRKRCRATRSMDLLNWLVDSDPSIRWQVRATWTEAGAALLLSC